MDGIVLSAQTMQLPISAAPHLKERYERFMDAIASEHPGNICDEAKAFLECIYRTIIKDRNGMVDEGSRGRATFIQLHDQAYSSLGTSEENQDIRSAIRRTAEAIGIFRNNYGAVSHGQDGYDNRTAELHDAQYIAREALSLATYMYSRHRTVASGNVNARLHYHDHPEFNDYLDAAGDVVVAGISMSPSEVLFNNDPIAYKEQLIEYEAEIKYERYLDSQADTWIELQGDIERGH